MWFKGIQIKNINSFSNVKFTFSKTINVLVGPNNSGKSTILNCIVSLQHQELMNISHRLGNNISSFDVQLGEDGKLIFGREIIDDIITTDMQNFNVTKKAKYLDGLGRSVDSSVIIHSQEPDNLIYPYLSKRKTGSYSEEITSKTTNSITGDLQFLFAKIDRLCNRFHKGHDTYYNICEKIFGYPISVIGTEKGKKAAYVISENNYIPLKNMGEGVPNLLGLIVNLCVAENKIFVLEELENDIHPRVLKILLELILEKSYNNQFLISTHSNIVLRYLGSNPSTKVYKVEMDRDDRLIPLSSVKEVISTSDRISVLEDLGYDFYDFGLFKGWLFLEEASAEWIIREFLIPKFAKSLMYKIRTLSTKGVDQVESKFSDFSTHFLYAHLEPMYKNKAWILIDQGDNESNIIKKLKSDFVEKAGWNEDNFLQFDQHDFEKYYPASFAEKVSEVLKISDKKNRQKAKENLFNELKDWITNNEKLAIKEFEISAKSVIEILLKIERELQ